MAELTFEQLTKIIEVAKNAGVKEFHAAGVFVKFKSPRQPTYSVEFPKTPWTSSTQSGEIKTSGTAGTLNNYVPDAKAEELIKPMSVLDQLSAEEILYYATPHYDQIQADKEAHKKKLAGDPQ